MGSITDVPGVTVGHESDFGGLTGVTVILFESGAIGAGLTFGAAASTRGFESLHPRGAAKPVHAVCFAGGSTFGLGVTNGVQAYLRERGRGLCMDDLVVPLVPTAIIFDLFMGKPGAVPSAEMAYRACLNAGTHVEEGNVGAATGALVGKLFRKPQAMTGGIGTAAVTVGDVTIGALAVVNAVGDVRDPATGALIAGARCSADSLDLLDSSKVLRAGDFHAPAITQNTTLVLVATDAALTPIECATAAQMASAGFARSIAPVFTAFDGDLIVLVSVGKKVLDVTIIGDVAADLTARAIVRGVLCARPADGVPCAADVRLLQTAQAVG